MAFASLVVKIAAELQSLDAGLRKSVEKVKAFGSELTSIGSTLAIGISAPLAAFGTAAISSAADLEALKLGLTAVTGSAAAAKTQFEQLREVAKLPGLGLQEAVQGAVNLQAVRFSAEKTKTILLQFGNALASVGRGREDLNEVIRQLGQLASRGKVTADNLKPIIERVPQVASIINEKFGTIDTETLQKLGISSEFLIDTLISGLGKLQRVNGGLKNDIENLRDSLTIALAQAGDALAPFAKTFIDDFAVPAISRLGQLAEGFKGLSEPVKTAIVALGGIATVGPVVLVVVGQLITSAGLIASAFAKLGGAAGALTLALNAIPWVAAGAGALYLGNALINYREATNGAADAEKTFQDSLQKTVALLNKQGVKGVNELNKQYQSGAITQEAFAKSLRELALAHGATVKPANEHAAALYAVEAASRHYKKVAHELAPLMEVLVAKQRILEADRRKDIETIARHQLEQEGLIEKTGQYIDALDRLPPQLHEATEGIKKLGQQSIIVQQEIQKVASELGSIDVGISSKSIKIAVDDAKKAGKEMEKDAKQGISEQEKAWRHLGQQVSLVTNDLARNITDLIFKGGKLKTVLVGMVQDIAKALLRAALEKQFQKIASIVGDLLTKIPGLGKALGSIFGAGGSAASKAGQAAGTAAQTAGTVAGSVGSAGGGVASAAGGAASGAVGIIGAAGAVAGAISSIIGNFQMAGMNKSLDLIVKHTLQTANQLIEGVQPQLNKYLPMLVSIHDRLATVVGQGVGVYNAPGDAGLRIAGGAGGGTVFNFDFRGANLGGLTPQLAQNIMTEAARKIVLAGA